MPCGAEAHTRGQTLRTPGATVNQCAWTGATKLHEQHAPDRRPAAGRGAEAAPAIPKPEKQHDASSRSSTETRCWHPGAPGAGDAGMAPRPKPIGPPARSPRASPAAPGTTLQQDGHRATHRPANGARREGTRYLPPVPRPPHGCPSGGRNQGGRWVGCTRQGPLEEQSSFLPFQLCLSGASIVGSRSKLKTKSSRSHAGGTQLNLPAAGSGLRDRRLQVSGNKDPD